jgi:hypothetical protein
VSDRGSGVGRRALVFLGLWACGPSAGEQSQAREQAALAAHGPAVARVGEAEIGLHDVEQAARATGLKPESALERLVAEQLLGQYAEQQGYGEGAEVERELKKARARALLAEAVERDITAASIPADEVAKRFAGLKGSLDRPDSRVASWLTLPRAAGDRVPLAGATEAEAALERLSGLPLPALRAELTAIRDEAEERGVHVVLEQTQRVAVASQSHEPALLKALKAQAEPGLVPRVIDTPRGALVVVVEEVLPPREATLEEHEAPIREQLVLERRAERTRELLDKLAAGTTVRYEGQAIQQALADDSLLGTLP